MQYLQGIWESINVKCTVNGDSFGFGSENAARSVEPITVHNIIQSRLHSQRNLHVSNHQCRWPNNDYMTAVVGEDALKDDRRYSGFTVSGKKG
ncbi:hypothetical protein TNCV_263461 [Trichonephila clavipes]|nr:hypothetical protein TNCV_263461 [Trichonephila clavipes]